MELVLSTNLADGIYQDPNGDDFEPDPDDFGSFPALEFDSYVTIGVDDPDAVIFGAAISIDPDGAQAFGGQDLNVAWHAPIASEPGPGQIQVARVTLKDIAIGSWTIKGWQSGGFDPVTISGELTIPGDVDQFARKILVV